jgi:pectate lyase
MVGLMAVVAGSVAAEEEEVGLETVEREGWMELEGAPMGGAGGGGETQFTANAVSQNKLVGDGS